jgi:hypothetical protein
MGEDDRGGPLDAEEWIVPFAAGTDEGDPHKASLYVERLLGTCIEVQTTLLTLLPEVLFQGFYSSHLQHLLEKRPEPRRTPARSCLLPSE